MTEDTITEETTTEGTVDLIAATVTRWSFTDDETFARMVEQRRLERNRKVEAYTTIARVVGEHDLPWPHLAQWSIPKGAGAAVHYYTEDLDSFRLLVRAVRRAVGGVQTKANEDGSLTATVISEDVAWAVKLGAEASPCEKVEVGTETKVEREEIAPPKYREVEREVPVYRWECPESILEDGDQPEADEEDDS